MNKGLRIRQSRFCFSTQIIWSCGQLKYKMIIIEIELCSVCVQQFRQIYGNLSQFTQITSLSSHVSKSLYMTPHLQGLLIKRLRYYLAVKYVRKNEKQSWYSLFHNSLPHESELLWDVSLHYVHITTLDNAMKQREGTLKEP